jgi:hypothetical protein
MSARQPRSLRPAALLVGFGLLAYVGCSSSGATTTSVTHPTMVEVAPEDFLGDVPCSDAPGLKRYVATLFDTNYVAEGGAGGASAEDTAAGGARPDDFQLPSSLPTPCRAAVGFGLVVPGRHYRVEIDGYDTDDLAPRALGSREMVSPAPTNVEPAQPLATPRWIAHCDNAVAVGLTIVRADHCATFQPPQPDAPGSVRIALGRLLGGLSCGNEAGQVDHFSVRLSTGEELTTVACTADAEAVFTAEVARSRVSATVSAFSADEDEAFAGATCDAFTRPAASVNAECSQLSQVGTLRVDLKSALAQLKLGCNVDQISTVTVDVPNDKTSRSFAPPDCLQPFEHGFAAGDGVVTVTALTPSGKASSLTCGAKVQPGQLVLAECQPK